MQDHRKVGVPEEGVDPHKLVVHARALPGDVVALRAQVTHTRLVGGAVNRVDTDVLARLVVAGRRILLGDRRRTLKPAL